MIKHCNGKLVYESDKLYYQLYVTYNSENYFFNFSDIEQLSESIAIAEKSQNFKWFNENLNEKILPNNCLKLLLPIFYSFVKSSQEVTLCLNWDILRTLSKASEKYIILYNLDSFGSDFIIEFRNNISLTFDLEVLKYYARSDNYINALQYSINKVMQVLNSEVTHYKMIVNDVIIFEEYLQIEKKLSQYFGFIDIPNISTPLLVDTINTQNILAFLNLYKDFLVKKQEIM